MKLVYLSGMKMRTCNIFLTDLVGFGLISMQDGTKPVFYYPNMAELEKHFDIVKDFLIEKHRTVYDEFSKKLWKVNKKEVEK
jgi:hypothetical protein